MRGADILHNQNVLDTRNENVRNDGAIFGITNFTECRINKPSSDYTN